MERYSNLETIKISAVITQISKVFEIEKITSEAGKDTYFDTFDGRLYKHGLYLTKRGNSYTLSRSLSLEPLTSMDARLKKDFLFWHDFPTGQLQNELKKLIDIRALISLVTMNCKNQVFGILNKDEKLVARLIFQEVKPVNAAKASSLFYLTPVKGYNKEYKGVKKILLDAGATPDNKDLLQNLLPATSVSYTGKLKITLSPYMTTQRAFVAILRNLISTIRQNEQGIIKDVDTEFLHDFRVAVRRARSLFSQVKSVFPQEVTDRAKWDFATLGKMTNKLRDLDVYLLKRARYMDMLPKDLRPGIESVFRRLEIERKEEQKKLSRYLASASYKKTIIFWDDFLENRNSEEIISSNSAVPVIETAKRSIFKKYRKVVKLGRLINDQTPDLDIHSLRIECKKLRYLLEFFSSLFTGKEITLMINHLKKLQNNLGDFNDLYVQQENLRKFLETDGHKNKNLETMAVGGLIASLYKKQQKVRNQFSEKFKKFGGKENIEVYNKLFFQEANN